MSLSNLWGNVILGLVVVKSYGESQIVCEQMEKSLFLEQYAFSVCIGELMENWIFNKEISRLHGIFFRGQNHAFHIGSLAFHTEEAITRVIKKWSCHINKRRNRKWGFFFQREHTRKFIWAEIHTRRENNFFKDPHTKREIFLRSTHESNVLERTQADFENNRDFKQRLGCHFDLPRGFSE